MSNKNNLILVGVAAAVVIIGAVLVIKNPSSPSNAPANGSQMAQNQMDMSSAPSQVQGVEASPSGQSVASTSGQDSNVKEFTVTGFNYGFSPKTLTVNKGDTVKITFKNSGGFHDFVLDEFNVKTKTIKGGDSDTVSFVADKAGTFQFYCSVDHHRQMGMVGTLTVQ